MFYRAKNCITTALALAICLLLGGFFCAKERVLLSKTQGERTFYLDSASSQGLIKTELAFADLFRIRGESVSFLCEQGNQELVLQIFDSYGAEICFTERVGEITSYYGYAQGLGMPVWVQGFAINLHVAVGESRCAVGTPIIFGGF